MSHSTHSQKNFVQLQRDKQVLKFSTVRFHLPDIQHGVVCVADIQQPLFICDWDRLSLEDVVEEFRGIIDQNGELVHTGDFVKLTHHHSVKVSSTDYEEVTLPLSLYLVLKSFFITR